MGEGVFLGGSSSRRGDFRDFKSESWGKRGVLWSFVGTDGVFEGVQDTAFSVDACLTNFKPYGVPDE